MLHTNTNKLLTYLTTSYPNYTVVSNYIQSIRKLGTRKDVSVLMAHYYENPKAKCVDYILSLLYDFGTLSDAKDLWECSFENNKLKLNYPEEILHILGYLGLQESCAVLLDYALHSGDHNLNQNAVLGLIHLDCSAYQFELLEGIEACYCKNFFPEFSPALVCKVSNQYDILSHFYKLGSGVVSTDCNGGIVLAFSLCGELGKGFFFNVLWDENWECLGGGTGTDYWAYIAMQNLNISFLELYGIIQTTTDNEILEYQLKVFRSLLRYRLIDAPHPIQFIQPNRSSLLELYQALYAWKDENTSDNIVDLARRFDLSDEFYQLRTLLESKMREEMLFL